MELFKRKSYDQEITDLYLGDYYLEQQNMQKKKWYQSLTIWFNIAILVLTAVNEFNQIVPLPLEVMTFVTVCGNLLLRVKTVTGIK